MEEDGNSCVCRKCRAGGCVRVKKGTVNVQDCGPHPCPWIHGPGGWCGVLWRPGELLWRQSHIPLHPGFTTMAALFRCHGTSPLPLHWILLSLGYPPAISFSLPTSEDFLASLGNFPLGLRHPPFPLPQPMASLSRLRGSTMS